MHIANHHASLRVSVDDILVIVRINALPAALLQFLLQSSVILELSSFDEGLGCPDHPVTPGILRDSNHANLNPRQDTIVIFQSLQVLSRRPMAISVAVVYRAADNKLVRSFSDDEDIVLGAPAVARILATLASSQKNPSSFDLAMSRSSSSMMSWTLASFE